MNIQIFGKNKCFDTKKAQRYFKEHNIKFQNIDLLEYGMRDKEYADVVQSLGSYEVLLDTKCKEYKNLYFEYLRESEKEKKLKENPSLMKTPIVRNGRKCTLGYQPAIWKQWQEEEK